MRLTFLGTGTSTGVPQIGCGCDTCKSDDPRDHRLRASAFVEKEGQILLIDCGPDFREQALRARLPRLDGVLLTHSHYDHVGGLDDLRPFTYPDGLNIYCSEDVAQDIRIRMPYCFADHLYPGVPQIKLNIIKPFHNYQIGVFDVQPIPAMHYKLKILGFKIGRMAYLTDVKTISREALEAIHGIDVLVINALRHSEHISHINLQQALEIVKTVNPRQAWLIHMSHDMGRHADIDPTLPSNVHLAYDTLSIDV